MSSLRTAKRLQKLFRLESQNLASPVVSARWTGRVWCDSAAALRAFV